MTAIRQTIYNGVLFTIKNTVPALNETDKAVQLKSLSSDLKRALDRVNKLNKIQN